MQKFRISLTLVAACFLTTFSTAAVAADCKRIGAVGDGLTTGIATLMSENGLKTLIASKGRKGQGAVTTKCEAGTFLTQCRSSQVACK